MSKSITWFSTSPDAGDPSCLCSWCEQLITEAQAPAIRLFDSDTNREARFHRGCYGAAMGLAPNQEGDEDDSDYPAAGRGDDWDDEDESEFDCGWVRGVGCQLAGTEECDFECPFRDDNYRGLRLTQARLAKRAQ